MKRGMMVRKRLLNKEKRYEKKNLIKNKRIELIFYRMVDSKCAIENLDASLNKTTYNQIIPGQVIAYLSAFVGGIILSYVLIRFLTDKELQSINKLYILIFVLYFVVFAIFIGLFMSVNGKVDNINKRMNCIKGRQGETGSTGLAGPEGKQGKQGQSGGCFSNQGLIYSPAFKLYINRFAGQGETANLFLSELTGNTTQYWTLGVNGQLANKYGNVAMANNQGKVFMNAYQEVESASSSNSLCNQGIPINSQKWLWNQKGQIVLQDGRNQCMTVKEVISGKNKEYRISLTPCKNGNTTDMEDQIFMFQ